MVDYGGTAGAPSHGGDTTGTGQSSLPHSISLPRLDPWSSRSLRQRRLLNRQVAHFEQENVNRPGVTSSSKRPHHLQDSMLAYSEHVKMLKRSEAYVHRPPSVDFPPESGLHVQAKSLPSRQHKTNLQPLTTRRKSMDSVQEIGELCNSPVLPSIEKVSYFYADQNKPPAIDTSHMERLLANVQISNGIQSESSHLSTIHGIKNSRKIEKKNYVSFQEADASRKSFSNNVGLSEFDISIDATATTKPADAAQSSTAAVADSLSPDEAQRQREARTKDLLRRALQTLHKMEADHISSNKPPIKLKVKYKHCRRVLTDLHSISESDEISQGGRLDTAESGYVTNSGIDETEYSKHSSPHVREHLSPHKKKSRVLSPIKEDHLRSQRIDFKSRLVRRTKIKFLKHT